MIIEEDPKDIWKTALPLLGSPQKRTISINLIEAVLGYKKSGDSALSYYTMIAEPKNPVYAVSEIEFKALKNDDKFKFVPYPERESVRKIEAMVRATGWNKNINIVPDIRDRYPFIFNCRNGMSCIQLFYIQKVTQCKS